jgi:hypothetical protein
MAAVEEAPQSLLMKPMTFVGSVLMFLLGSANFAQAQQQPSSIAFTTAAVATIQPVDDTYVGPEGPYLSAGLGGVGAGASAGMTAVLPGNVSPAFEFSTAYLRHAQTGRLVSEDRPGVLVDSLVSALVGTTTRQRVFAWRAGVSWITGPAVHGVPIYDGAHLGLTLGVDVVRKPSARRSLLATIRYSEVQRSQAATFVGIGRHIIRVALGVQWNRQ